MKKLLVKINGKQYEVELEVLEDSMAPTPLPYYNPGLHRSENFALSNPTMDNPMAFRPKKADASKSSLEAAVNGTILEVYSKVGQTVAAGDLAMAIEAMKMKTNIYHAKDGVVKTVEVGVGEVVETGATLLTYE